MKFIDEMLERKQASTILKLHKIFSMGYMPSRGNECYKAIHAKTNKEVTFLINCMAHSFFNLSNKQLEDFDECDATNFRQFYWPDDSQQQIYTRVLTFVRKTGLMVEKTSLSHQVKHGQWKVAVYFVDLENYERKTPDFHFVLQEKDGRWASKEGSFPNITYYDDPPEYFVSRFGSYKPYKLHEYLLVTNPYAKNMLSEDAEAEKQLKT